MKTECQTPGCIYPAFRRGLCAKHYNADRAQHGPRCSISGCDDHVHSGGMCNKHYRQERLKRAPPCSVAGCERPVHTAGLCSTHHKRLRTVGHLDPTRPEDWGGRSVNPHYKRWVQCRRDGTLCDEWRDDFWAFVIGVGDKPSPSHIMCRKDVNIPMGPNNFHWREKLLPAHGGPIDREWYRKWGQAYREKNRDKFRAYDRNRNLRKLGTNPEEYDSMLSAQDGVCALCGNPETALNPKTQEPRGLAVDHDHKTGKVRGLLCTGCNTALGLLKDDPALLEAAIAYLKRPT